NRTTTAEQNTGLKILQEMYPLISIQRITKHFERNNFNINITAFELSDGGIPCDDEDDYFGDDSGEELNKQVEVEVEVEVEEVEDQDIGKEKEKNNTNDIETEEKGKKQQSEDTMK